MAIPGHSQTFFFFDGWYNNRICENSTKLFSYQKILLLDTFGLFHHKNYKIIKLFNIFNKKLIDEQYSEISISKRKSISSYLVYLCVIYLYAYNFDSTSHKCTINVDLLSDYSTILVW